MQGARATIERGFEMFGAIPLRTPQELLIMRDAGRIVAQSPSQGKEVARDSLISLLVGQGKEEEKYLMPDLLGRQADPIIAWLESLEFRVGDTRRAVYRGLEPGIIINQNPPQGYPISQRSLITLEVSK